MASIDLSEDIIGKERAALFLGISVSSLDKWVKDKRIAAMKVGRNVLFEKSKLEQFREKCRLS